ncbi:MAG: alpha/beta hydrolase [Candidatus Lustribacter sp.]|jgi:pimeloyl-ACP methyl ester carboxylesterase
MPFIQRSDATIYYEVFGEGFPVLAFAPGYLRSELAFWKHTPSDPSRKAPWPNVPVDLVPPFRVIAMDQRYAGKSQAAVTADVGWQTYADDHLAILDALELERCHLIGVCIGTAFALTLCERAPGRVASAVLQNPVGRTEANRAGTMAEFARWADGYREKHPEAAPDALAAMGRNMFDRDFAFAASRETVKGLQTPMLVLPGTDPEDGPHPASVGNELFELLPHAELVSAWRGEADQAPALHAIRDFLQRRTP